MHARSRDSVAELVAHRLHGGFQKLLFAREESNFVAVVRGPRSTLIFLFTILLVIGLERNAGEISRFETQVLPEGHPDFNHNLDYVERIVKFLLWQRGGLKLYVGGREVLKADVRILAATNQDLERAIKDKRFREDLYYRLNICSVYLPPLRDREGDIELLADFFLEKHNRLNAKAISFIERDVLDLLEIYKYIETKDHQYHATPSLSHMFALNYQLDRILAEGLEKRYARHLEMARFTRAWAKEHFALFPEERYASVTLTTISNTKAIPVAGLNGELGKLGMQISNGYGDLKEKTFRIAHMGELTLADVTEVTRAIEKILPTLK